MATMHKPSTHQIKDLIFLGALIYGRYISRSIQSLRWENSINSTCAFATGVLELLTHTC